ncbi:hypothetical protein MTDSW087_04399 [Methylobacterium dankookense]|uniref:Uncharacterized protein n=1 Tax=Methylobacterium dankookense TaxID=560405 RepID=A0A564G3N5_9HYPH|nr:hypothetical protein IFDJLNFL_3799 [Methylobacterium dankookense]VUF14674.1 hypothetical protein MTDSW087_04399 [Methylobacterium dankookense]
MICRVPAWPHAPRPAAAGPNPPQDDPMTDETLRDAPPAVSPARGRA